MDTYNDSDKLAEQKIIETLIEGLVLSGDIDIHRLSYSEAISKLKSIADNNEISIIVDYTKSLIKEARFYFKKDQHEMACLFYSTWLEHWINNIIALILKKKKWNDKEIVEVIRNVSFQGKYTWFLKIIDLKKIDGTHLKKIIKVSELRNNFVHYKWKEYNQQSEKELSDVLNDFEKTIKYLNQYQNELFFKNKKRTIKKILKNK